MSSNNRDRLDAGGSAAVRAAPAVRSLAKKLGVDLEKCVGTGRDGTITMNDVIARTNQVKANRAASARPIQSQPARRAPEPVSAAPIATPSRPVGEAGMASPFSPTPNPPRGWMSEIETPEAATEDQPPSWEQQPEDEQPQIARPRAPQRMQPPAPPSARSWATMEDEPDEQPDPRVAASRLQDLSAYDFPSAERQPTEPLSDPNDAYAPRTSWFATAETSTDESVESYEETIASQPSSSARPPQNPNPWGAVEVEEQDGSSSEQAQYEADFAADVPEEPPAEEYVELASSEPEVEQATGSPNQPDWNTPLAADDVAEESLADDLTPYEPEAEAQAETEADDAAVMTTVYEAPDSRAAVESDLTVDDDWVKPTSSTPETPAEWAQPEYPTYANTVTGGAEGRAVPLRTPYLDMTPRTLVDQEDRLHGLRRNMALNMTRSRDEIATCTMFDDADLNAWPNFSHITVRLLRAIVAGIRVEPGFNATFDPAGPSRRLLRQINVAVSVDTREGLTVPVLRDIGSRSMEDLREYVYHMKERTLTRSLSPEDLRDFSFSLANYGIFAGRYATPPVVPPAVATLGCGRLERAVVAGETAPEIHAMLPLSLTFDHRCVTMGEACRFLAALKQDLELPE
jgi:pyruvate/2-oxoglutarate dehydrogenase complex dihydrolipoamide acyltransferase (E2) component